MKKLNFNNDVLHVEKVSLEDIAKSVGTPVYVYSKKSLIENYSFFHNTLKKTLGSKNDFLVAYSVKSNSNIGVINVLSSLNSGADVVSSGELKRSLMAGISANKIVFSGVGKTDEELAYAINENILQFNVESIDELKKLSSLAVSNNKIAPIAIRVNPDINAGGHQNISTGVKNTKFGIDYEEAHNVYDFASNLEGIKIVGIDVHIGSQISSLEPFRLTFNKISTLVKILRKKGHNVFNIDLGGGIGIQYDDSEKIFSLKEYSETVFKIFGDLDCRIVFEPGRYISGNTGLLLTKIIRNKSNNNSNFIIVDAAMNDFLRPVLYNASHNIVEVRKIDKINDKKYFKIVGPVCETGDIFSHKCHINNIEEGNLLAILDAGAYGASMSSAYNSRDIIPEVLVEDKNMHVIRKRISTENLLSFENIPK